MKKLVLFWLFVVLLPLFLVSVALNHQTQAKGFLDIGLKLKTEPGSLYVIGDRFNLKPMGNGEYLWPVKPEVLSAFRFLFIEDVEADDLYQIKLLWKQRGQLLLEQSVKQGLSDFSVILPTQFSGIEDLELAIKLNRIEQPKVANHFSEPFSFSQIKLKSDFPQARLQHAVNTWLSFVPITFHSMNYWRQPDKLFSVWLLVPVFVYLSLVLLLWRLLRLSGNALITFSLCCVILSTMPYWVNQWRVLKLQRHAENSVNQSSTAINRTDNKLMKVANKLLESYHQQQLNRPLLIAKEDDFERTRLAYHLSSLNVYHMPYVDDLLPIVSQSDNNYLLLIETNQEYCQLERLNSLSPHYQLLWQLEGYCLLIPNRQNNPSSLNAFVTALSAFAYLGAKRPADPVGWRRAGNEQMTVLPKAKKSSVNAVARQSEGRAFDSTPSCAAGFHTQYERREARHLDDSFFGIGMSF